MSKSLMMTSWQSIVMSMFFFQFMVNLQPPGSSMPDAWSIKLTFSLTITFHLTKTETRTKKSLKVLFLPKNEILFLPKNPNFLAKYADTSKIKGVLVLKRIFSKTRYVKFQDSSVIVTCFRQGVILLPSYGKSSP